MIRSIKLLLKISIYFILASIVKLVIPKRKAALKVLLIKTDGIGDYMIFRNFIWAYKASLEDREIDLLCSTFTCELAESYDGKYFSQILSLDVPKFERNIHYVFKVLYKIRKNGYCNPQKLPSSANDYWT